MKFWVLKFSLLVSYQSLVCNCAYKDLLSQMVIWKDVPRASLSTHDCHLSRTDSRFWEVPMQPPPSWFSKAALSQPWEMDISGVTCHIQLTIQSTLVKGHFSGEESPGKPEQLGMKHVSLNAVYLKIWYTGAICAKIFKILFQKVYLFHRFREIGLPGWWETRKRYLLGT